MLDDLINLYTVHIIKKIHLNMAKSNDGQL